MSGTKTARITFYTAISIVIANMIGSGVFTSLGFQALGFQAIFPLLMLWFVGGIVALCGALCYGELAALMPRSGGEYNFLSKIYHPSFGFMAGWVSATVGFPAPAALAATALGRYTHSVWPAINETYLAATVVILLTLVHAFNIHVGSSFQKYSTALKVSLIIFFIGAGLMITPEPQAISIVPQSTDLKWIFSSSFAISLAYVSFSYSGWNASAYLTNEIENPRVNVPRSLFLGTLLVTLAYILLNFVFLYTIPVSEVANKQLELLQTTGAPLEVGYLSANNIFGLSGGKIMAGMIALLLVSSISALIFAGPRVTQVMAEDLPILGKLVYTNKQGIPVVAVVFQSIITLFLIFTSSFDAILKYIAFTLDIFTFSAVLGVIILRYRQPHAERSYKAWGYPITPLIFLLATGWTMVVLLQANTQGSLIALATVFSGLIVYYWDQYKKNKAK